MYQKCHTWAIIIPQKSSMKIFYKMIEILGNRFVKYVIKFFWRFSSKMFYSVILATLILICTHTFSQRQETILSNVRTELKSVHLVLKEIYIQLDKKICCVVYIIYVHIST